MEIPSTITSSLLKGIRNNHQESWNRMVTLYYPLVYAWCRKAGLGSEDSSDIGQEVFKNVAQGIRNFVRENPSDTFTGWLRTITRRRIFDHRKKRHQEPILYEGNIHSIAATLDNTEEIALGINQDYLILFRGVVESIRGEFEQQTWTLFWDYVVHQKSVGEICQEHMVQPNSIYLAKSRILKRLRTQLKPPIN